MIIGICRMHPRHWLFVDMIASSGGQFTKTQSREHRHVASSRERCRWEVMLELQSVTTPSRRVVNGFWLRPSKATSGAWSGVTQVTLHLSNSRKIGPRARNFPRADCERDGSDSMSLKQHQCCRRESESVRQARDRVAKLGRQMRS